MDDPIPDVWRHEVVHLESGTTERSGPQRTCDSGENAVLGTPAATVWGDESAIAAAAVALAARRMTRASDPKATARPSSELVAGVGQMITKEGVDAQEVLSVFEQLLAPATRAQDDPLNLAYIPAAPTRAAFAFVNPATQTDAVIEVLRETTATDYP